MTPPIIIDFEASGFGKDSYPIEVGYADEAGETWCSLISPHADWQHWDDNAEKLHKISREALLKHGKDAITIARHLNDVFLNKVVYSDAWGNDYPWMSRLFDLANTSPHFKLEDLRQLLNPHQQSIWHQTRQSVMDKLQKNRHRASCDAKVLQLTWIQTAGYEVFA